MKKVLITVGIALMLAATSFAGVAKLSYKSAKFAGKESGKVLKFSSKRAEKAAVKSAKVAKKVLY